MGYRRDGDVTPGRPWTRRMYLMVRALEAMPVGVHSTVKLALAHEAVASTAIEHPEWDMEEERQWQEWEDDARG